MSTVLSGLTIASALLLGFGQTGNPTSRTAPRVRALAPPVADAGPIEAGRRRRLRRIGLGVLAGTVAILVGPVLTIGGAVSGLLIVRLRRIAAQRRAQQAIDRDLPETLDLIVLLLTAGVSLRSVVTEVGRRGPMSTRPAFAQVADRLDIGEPFTEAVVQLRTRLGSGAVALVDLITAAHRYGLPMAQVIGQLSTEARSARRRRNEALARALPVKLSFPLVVCTLPSFVFLAIVPAVMAALTSLGTDSW